MQKPAADGGLNAKDQQFRNELLQYQKWITTGDVKTLNIRICPIFSTGKKIQGTYKSVAQHQSYSMFVGSPSTTARLQLSSVLVPTPILYVRRYSVVK